MLGKMKVWAVFQTCKIERYEEVGAFGDKSWWYDDNISLDGGKQLCGIFNEKEKAEEKIQEYLTILHNKFGIDDGLVTAFRGKNGVSLSFVFNYEMKKLRKDISVELAIEEIETDEWDVQNWAEWIY